jgi:hypothetical protein
MDLKTNPLFKLIESCIGWYHAEFCTNRWNGWILGAFLHSERIGNISIATIRLHCSALSVSLELKAEA